MPLATGSRLGSYEITGQIGAGGMGEVYRAHDTRLDRDVAIKVLPVAFAAEPERIARFDREAKTLAALNHPNIAQIYGIEDSKGMRAIVMELVEGETLAERIARGPIPIDEALQIAKDIAEALEAAHEQAIIHRDLKPANIKVRPDGTVKVLDFGLAKLVEPSSVLTANPSSLSMSPTITSPALVSGVGVMLGTAAYMSPEQAKGRPADKRSDLWAFGCVLFEELTGKQPFGGVDVAEVFAAVLKTTPDWNALPTATPPEIVKLLHRCLEKERRRRLDSAAAARLDLIDAIARGDRPNTVASGPRLRATLAVTAVMSIAALVALAAIRGVATSTVAPNPTLRLSAILSDEGTFNPGSTPVLSPDGTKLAYSVLLPDGRRFLSIRDLNSSGSRRLSGTDGANYPFWSPDSRFVAFFADGKLKKIDVATGAPRTICDAPNSYVGSWSSNDVIIFTPNFTSGLAQVAAAGGMPTPVTRLDAAAGEISHRYPWFLPDGHHFIYLSVNRDEAKSTVYVDDVDSVDRSIRRALLPAQSTVAYGDGRLLLVRGQALMAAPLDLATLQIRGEFVPIAEPVDSGTNTGQYLFTVSQNGMLAFASGVVGTDIALTWFDQDGKPSGTIGPKGDVLNPRIAPDGHAVAVDRRDPRSGGRDIWLYDRREGSTTRLTFNIRLNRGPVWSPDGSRVAFGVFEQGGQRIYEKAVYGSTAANPMMPLPGATQTADWSRDGRFLIANVQRGTTNWDVWALPVGGHDNGAKPFAVAETTAPERFARLSPDGRWLAYQSDLGAGNEIYVQAFPTANGARQVSVGGGSIPVWSHDGKQLFYFASGKIWGVTFKSVASTVVTGNPRPILDASLAGARSFDVGPDGRFLIPVDAQSSGTPITVVTNWSGLLKQ